MSTKPVNNVLSLKRARPMSLSAPERKAMGDATRCCPVDILPSCWLQRAVASFHQMVDRRLFLKLATLGCLDLAWPGIGFSAPVPAERRGKSGKGKVLLCLKPTEPGKSTIRLYDW